MYDFPKLRRVHAQCYSGVDMRTYYLFISGLTVASATDFGGSQKVIVRLAGLAFSGDTFRSGGRAAVSRAFLHVVAPCCRSGLSLADMRFSEAQR